MVTHIAFMISVFLCVLSRTPPITLSLHGLHIGYSIFGDLVVVAGAGACHIYLDSIGI
jgi:hypothetical protein